MTRKSLYEILKQCSTKKIEEKLTFLEDHLKNITNCPENEESSLKNLLRPFKFQFKQKWIAASYKEERFFRNNEQWLDTTITLPTWTIERPGRPSKDFNESSSPTRRRKTRVLREQVPCEQLTYAAQMSYRAAGHSDASIVIKDILFTPSKAKIYKKKCYSYSKGYYPKAHSITSIIDFCGSRYDEKTI